MLAALAHGLLNGLNGRGEGPDVDVKAGLLWLRLFDGGGRDCRVAHSGWD